MKRRALRLGLVAAPIACMMHCSGPVERAAPGEASRPGAPRLEVIVGRPDEPIVLRGPEGVGVSMTLVGARGPTWSQASPLGGGVRFVRHEGAFEDFVEVAARPARARLSYELGLDGVAAVRAIEGVVELLDSRGAPRLRMAPPRMRTRAGDERPVAAELAGCTVERDARPPWGRPHPAPGASTCTLHLSWEARDDEYPLWVDPAWVAGPNMVALRSLHRAVRLDDGRVLVVGGQKSPDPGAELYDPATSSWATVAGAARHGVFATATKLADGRVLVAGGTDLSTHVRFENLDVYDPKAGAFAAVTPFVAGRAGHSATLMQDGRVLFVGGFVTLDVTKEVLAYEPDVGLRSAPPLPGPRGHHAAALLPDGRVLVTGGETCCDSMPFAPLASSLLFDPKGGGWTAGPPLLEARYDHTLDRLADGTLVVAGGSTEVFDKGQLASVEAIDPGLSAWGSVGFFAVPRSSHRTALMPNGRLLVAGTFGPDFTATSVRLTEQVDGARRRVDPMPNLGEARSGATVTTLADGRALVAGGGGIDRGSRTSELLGTPLGAACGADECTNGFCVEGVCCASEVPCKVLADAGPAPPDASVADAGADAATIPPDTPRTSYHACSAGAPSGSRGAAPVGLAALGPLGFLLARRQRRRRRRV